MVGLKEAGKDTLYRVIKKVFPCAERIAFADALKEELAAACDVSVEDIEREKARYRVGLQWWGTEFRRMQDPRYWLDQVAWKIKRSQAPVIVITDVRYVDEGHLVKSHGGILVKVVRDMPNPRDPHSSEQYALDMTPDLVVWNSGTSEFDLHHEAKELLSYIHTLKAKRENPSS